MSHFRQLAASQSTVATNVSQSVVVNGLTNAPRHIRFVNSGPQTVWVEFGYRTPGHAPPVAVVGTSIPVPPSSVEMFTIGPQCNRYALIAAANHPETTLTSTVGDT